MGKALILVDIQNDFIPGGALAVSDGDAIIEVANNAMEYFDYIIATRDWHPSDHASFASQYKGRNPGEFIELNGLTQILWPDHCVMNSKGAEFVEGLNVEKITKVFKKGVNREVDSYSGFFDNDQQYDTGLGDYLKTQDIDEVFIMGLATDYCVKYTVMDARRLGFKTRLIKEGVRGVELSKGDSEKALEEMRNADIKVISINDLNTL